MKNSKRSLLRCAVSDISRFGQISSVLIRHGFGQIAGRVGITAANTDGMSPAELAADPAGTAKRLRAVFEELGPTFVKLGQVLSTRPDLLPPAYIQELSKLQDKSPPMPFDVVRKQIEEGLGQPLEAIFKRIETVELATGSIAQAHVGELFDGREVVVKVQRPNLNEIIRSDLDLLSLLARLLEATVEEMGLYSPTDIVTEFDKTLRKELDFLVEAKHIALFRELVKDRKEIWVPLVMENLSTASVLVMERIPGVKITDLEPGSPRAIKMALYLLDLAYSMLFEYGTFHGDPHPGNLIVTDDDRIGLIDFGLIGQISQQQQDILVGLIIAVVSGDIDGISRAVMQLGRPTCRIPLREFREEVVSIRSRYLHNSLGDIDLSQFVLELLEAGQQYRIRIPADYAILTKASVTMEGIIRHLYPAIDIPSTMAPYSRKLLLQRYGPQKISQSLLMTALSAGNMMRELPSQLSQLQMDLEYEGLRVKVENQGLAELRGALNAQGTKLALSILASALLLCFFLSSELSHHGPSIMAVVALVVAIILTLWVLAWHTLDGRVRKVRITPLLRLIQRARGE
ncbi:MAG: hypothetical protein AUK47_20600 [Deltaproteobacteria bacterium CG2_30_63_29]|nr:MAG: hypothetical protein AUK47_20600 [Deltaproteobacteria bacterium CG2_30_63_29]PJB38902.1 MAG: ABC transporter [Deltaproteobacteria bacterium CG_4_9_14_3_um_filter_63_12]